MHRTTLSVPSSSMAQAAPRAGAPVASGSLAGHAAGVVLVLMLAAAVAALNPDLPDGSDPSAITISGP